MVTREYSEVDIFLKQATQSHPWKSLELRLRTDRPLLGGGLGAGNLDNCGAKGVDKASGRNRESSQQTGRVEGQGEGNLYHWGP